MSRIPVAPRDPAEVPATAGAAAGTGSSVVPVAAVAPTAPVAPAAPALDTGARIAAAAFELFAAQGYDGTTVDAIAERAGIARRTFFRYFRSKDDVIFADHESLLKTVDARLAAAEPHPPTGPLPEICSVVRLVLLSYVADPQVSVQRYRLTRSVPALRERELASVQGYERAFSRYARAALQPTFTEAESVLRADVMAAAVVAAHNAVLREWLRSGGDYDPMPDLDQALAWVIKIFGPRSSSASSADRGAAADAAAGAPEPVAPGVVVAVFRADQPIDDVVERISRSL